MPSPYFKAGEPDWGAVPGAGTDWQQELWHLTLMVQTRAWAPHVTRGHPACDLRSPASKARTHAHMQARAPRLMVR